MEHSKNKRRRRRRTQHNKQCCVGSECVYFQQTKHGKQYRKLLAQDFVDGMKNRLLDAVGLEMGTGLGLGHGLITRLVF